MKCTGGLTLNFIVISPTVTQGFEIMFAVFLACHSASTIAASKVVEVRHKKQWFYKHQVVRLFVLVLWFFIFFTIPSIVYVQKLYKLDISIFES